MSRKKNQKAKILIIMEILKNTVGEDNAITTKEFCDRLCEYDIPCDRRTLADDIRLLEAFLEENKGYGFVIKTKKCVHGNAYYSEKTASPEKNPFYLDYNMSKYLILGMNSLRLTDDIEKTETKRIKKFIIDNSLPEYREKLSGYAEDDNICALDTVAAKILIDSIRSLTFVKSSMTDGIIDTIIKMSDDNDKRSLTSEKNSPYNGRHNENGMTLYQIDSIFRAIDNGKKLSFRYFDLDENRCRIYRHNGDRYIVEPLTLIPNDDHYYLICYDPDSEDNLRTYRIDRMSDVEGQDNIGDISPEAREMKASVYTYTDQIFRMFNGSLEAVTLEFEDKIIGNIFDKFGPDAKIERVGEKLCRITEEIRISPPFFGWLFQFSDKMKIISPRNVIDMYQEKCRNICGG